MSCRNFLISTMTRPARLMLRVHHEGKAICGTFERDEAETRAAAIQALTHQHNHPLKCTLEEAR
jgi:ATP-dependent Clp protease adaptor protein ClpS